jgi:DNA (cytosine-5)-methyltransferase 1
MKKQKKKILNLFAGLGGNRLRWEDCEVTAVESNPKIAKIYQENNPDDIVIVGDAMEFLKIHRNEYDFVWASPPCQKHSKMMKATRHDVADFFDMNLWQVIIFLSHFYKGSWVVENVKPYYEPLIKPTKELGRHLIWSNFEISDFEMPNIKNFITLGTAKETEKLKEWLGIRYSGNIYYDGNHCPGQVLRNCVHPDFGLHVFNCWREAEEQGTVNYKQKVLKVNK